MAKGSEMKWGEHDARECSICGLRLRLSDAFDARQLFDASGRHIGSVSFCAEHIGVRA